MGEKNLQELGLGKNEAKVYLALLEIGTSKVGELSKRTGIYRRTIYDALKGLMEKGLVSYIIKGKKRYFTASNPKILLDLVKEKEKKIKAMLPDLLSLKREEKEEIKAEIYTGKKALKSLIEEQIECGEFYGIGITEKAWDVLNFSMPHLIKKVVKKKTRAKLLVHKKAWNILNKIKSDKIKIKILPEEYYGPSSTLIWLDKVSISYYGDVPTIIVIENEKINKAYRNYFNLLWKVAKK